MGIYRNKIRILIYSGHCEIIGGDAKYLFDLANHLDSTRFEVSIITDINSVFVERAKCDLNKDIPISYLDTRPKLFNKTIVDNIYKHLQQKHFDGNGLGKYILRVLDITWRGRKIYRYLRYIVSLVSYFSLFHWARDRITNVRIFYNIFKTNREHVDIFHVNSGGYPAKEAGLIALVVAWCFRIPTRIMTIHSIPAPRRWQNYLLDRFWDWIIPRAATMVVSASEAVKEQLCRIRGFPADKIVVIYCGLVDVIPSAEQIANVSRDIAISEYRLLMVGNLDWEGKGWNIVFPALAKVKQQNLRFKLFIAGTGTPETLRDLKTAAAYWGVDQNVVFLGYRRDIALLNAISDICLVPSTCYEATPYTIKEGARAGKPVITTTVGGCVEAVEHNVSGLIIPPNDIERLSQAIILLLNDDKLRERMGLAARNLFLKKFLLEKEIEKHEELYLLKRNEQ